MARGERRQEEPRPPLPAPYRSPWRFLLEALQAVLADLGLQLRALWRRNRQGDLPLPRFWPQRLAGLFWPLIAALLLSLILLLVRAMLPAGQQPLTASGDSSASTAAVTGQPSVSGDSLQNAPVTAPPPSREATSVPAAAAVPPSLGRVDGPASGPGPLSSPDSGTASTAQPNVSGNAPAAAGSASDRSAPIPTSADDGSMPEAIGAAAAGVTQIREERGNRWLRWLRPAGDMSEPIEVGAESAAASQTSGADGRPALQIDPLLSLLAGDGGDPWLLAARVDPDAGLLTLTLADAAASRSDRSLQQRAELWQQRALDAGYERLELRDTQGRLRGRQALVGSGMILLAPDSLP